MYFKIIVVFVACLSPQIYSDESIDDAIEEIFIEEIRRKYAYDHQNKAMERLDLMLTKHVASGSRYNFLVSPLGLKLVLCLLTTTAEGNTRSELLSLLGFDLDENTMNKYSTTSSLLNPNLHPNVNLGSQIFVSDDVELRPKAINTAKTVFSTELKTLNIRDPFEATTKINSWVLNITQGKIYDSFNEYDVTNMAMLILNTLYFKDNFRHHFEPNATKIEQFYVSPTVSKSVPFMHVVDYFRYGDSKEFDAKIVGMSYTEAYVIYFIVPNTLMGLSHVFNNLHKLGTELNKVHTVKTNIDVTLPKFKLDYTSRLTGILKKLGVEEAFQDEAMFPNLGVNKLPHKRLKISEIMQRFAFDVNEYGSGVDQPLGKLEIGGPLKTGAEVVVNRPFLFVLENVSARKILLIGRISDPSVSQGYFEVV